MRVVGAGLDGLGGLAAVEVVAVVEVGRVGHRIPEGVRRVVHDAAQLLVHGHARHVTRVGLPWRAGGGRLVEPVARTRGHARPAPVVERDADGELVGREPAGDAVGAVADGPGSDRVVDAVRLVPGGDLRLRRVRVRVERVLFVGRTRRVPRPVHVVRHRVGEVEVLADLVRLDLADLVLPGGHRRGEGVGVAVGRALGVELVAELGQQRRVVRGVGRRVVVAEVTGRARVLPVDVEAVEDPGAGARAAVAALRGQVALDEHVDAGGDELLPGGGGGGRVGEVLGVGPTAERKKDLEVRVLLLQLLQLVEVAGDGLVVHVGGAVDADGGVEALLVVGEAVPGSVTRVRIVLARRVGVGGLGGLEAGQVGRVDVLEVVDQVVELARHPLGVEVLQIEGVLVDRPLVEVGDLDPAAGRRGTRGVARGGRAGGRAQERGGQAEHGRGRPRECESEPSGAWHVQPPCGRVPDTPSRWYIPIQPSRVWTNLT